MKQVEKQISQFVEHLFPSFYQEEGENFIAFTKAYYEWLESANSVLYHARNLAEYSDIDETIDEFILYFKEKYLKNVQFNTATNKELFLKNSQDFYKSKGTTRSVDLFFRLVYGVPARVYNPGQDLFRLSDGTWEQPVYLEVTDRPINVNYVGKTITGVNSGATAFVDRYVRRRVVSGKYINLFIISNQSGNFETGEPLKADDNVINVPVVIGSATTAEVVTGGSNFEVGEVVEFLDTQNASFGKAIITEVDNITGFVSFTLIEGGYGYRSVTGSGATATAVVNSTGYVNSVTVDTGGEYYLAPRITFVSANGTGANARAVVNSSGSISAIYVLDPGSGYSNTTPPVVVIDDTNVLISNSVLTLANVVATNNDVLQTGPYLVFETMSQDLARVLYNTVSGDAVVNTAVYYHWNTGVVLGTAQIVTIFEANSSEGNAVITYSGNTYNPANSVTYLYTSGNTGSIAIYTNSTSYIDVSAAGKVVGFASNVEIYTDETNGSYLIGEEVTQAYSGATGTVSAINKSAAITILDLTDSEGVYVPGYSIVGAVSAANSVVRSMKLRAGLTEQINQFYETTLNTAISSASLSHAQISDVSSGSGARFSIQSISDVETITFNTDYILTNTTNYELVQLNALQWGFPALPTANLSTIIDDALTTVSYQVGVINAIAGFNPGSDYQSPPFVLPYEVGVVSQFGYKDYLLHYTLSGGSGNYIRGEKVTGQTSGANGVIMEADTVNSILTVKGTTLMKRFEVGELLKGRVSGANSTITAIQNGYKYSGLNANVEATATEGEQSAAGLDIIDSGYGYVNEESVVFRSITDPSKTGTATIYLGREGYGEGRFTTTKGFVSSDKYIHDGEYYQEYSYEVLTALPFSQYKDVLLRAVHVAGTKPHGSIEDSVIANAQIGYGQEEYTYTWTDSASAGSDTVSVSNSSLVVTRSPTGSTGFIGETDNILTFDRSPVIRVWSNSTAYVDKKVISVTNSTSLNVTGPWPFTNTAAKYSITTYPSLGYMYNRLEDV